MHRLVTLSWFAGAVLALFLGCADGDRQQTDATLAGDAKDAVAEKTADEAGSTGADGGQAFLSLSGTIRYLDLEGGIYVIASDDTNYHPTNLAEEFEQDGLAVEAEVRRLDEQVSIGMVGPMVEVVSIRRVDQAPQEDGEGEGEAGVRAEAAPTTEGADSAETPEQSSVDDTGIGSAQEDSPPQPGGESELWGSGWQLVDLGGRQAMGQVRVTLEFPEEGGRAVGNASCNRFFGQVSIQGSSIAFLDVGTMKMACQPAVNDQEQRFLAALSSADRFELEGDDLRIYGGDNDQPLAFTRVVEEG